VPAGKVWLPQLVDATHAFKCSAGISYSNALRGRSLSCLERHSALDLSRFCATLSAHLSYIAGLFHRPGAECRRRGLLNPSMDPKIAISACRRISIECGSVAKVG
jgi:hypothetical protein